MFFKLINVAFPHSEIQNKFWPWAANKIDGYGKQVIVLCSYPSLGTKVPPLLTFRNTSEGKSSVPVQTMLHSQTQDAAEESRRTEGSGHAC